MYPTLACRLRRISPPPAIDFPSLAAVDVLCVQLSDKPVTDEVPQDGDVFIAYAADGALVELVLRNAMAQGCMPVRIKLPPPSFLTRFRQVLARIRGR